MTTPSIDLQLMNGVAFITNKYEKHHKNIYAHYLYEFCSMP